MSSGARQALVFTHVPFEDLGSLQPVLERRGFRIATVDAPNTSHELPAVLKCDLLIVLGGPLGICLGAQLMVAALGAAVYSGAAGAEIGWKAIQADGPETPAWFAPLLEPGVRVLHWHRDTFDLPLGAQRLAKTEAYENQAFAIGKNALALQFHPEVTAEGLERWYVGHAAELHQRGISVPALRADGQRFAAELAEPARRFWELWLDYIL
jgi:GMP synthase (glutamine-hydrolysing)